MSLRNPDETSPGTAQASHEQSAGGFPQDPSEFDNDPRISFSKLDNKFILETEDGQEYEYDSALKRWILTVGCQCLCYVHCLELCSLVLVSNDRPCAIIRLAGILQVDDALLEQQREAYKVEGVEEDETVTRSQLKKKRKQPANGDDENGQKPKRARVNTAVYVTSIPLNATVDEIRDIFCKCGVIAEEIDSGRPRIKMYMDDKGDFKGEALIVYFRPESVNLAIQMLDDSDFQLGESGPDGRMRVQAADFSFKSQQEAPAKTSARDKKKIIKRTQKLNSKLADWDDDDPSALADTSSRRERVVVLKHMFTLQEIEEDPAAILDIKEDIRDECSKLGDVTNVVLYDQEPDGVVTVRFSDYDAARQCVKLMRGRFFSGTQVEAYIADGSEKFKKTNERRAALEDMAEGNNDDDEESRRLDEFGSWLENPRESERIIESRAK